MDQAYNSKEHTGLEMADIHQKTVYFQTENKLDIKPATHVTETGTRNW